MCLFSPLSERFDHKSIFSLSKPISKSKTNRIGYHISMFKHLHSYLHPPSKWAHNLLGHNVKQAVLLNKCPPPSLHWAEGHKEDLCLFPFYMQLLNNNWRIVSFLFQLFLFPCPCRVPLWALSVLSRSIFELLYMHLALIQGNIVCWNMEEALCILQWTPSECK